MWFRSGARSGEMWRVDMKEGGNGGGRLGVGNGRERQGGRDGEGKREGEDGEGDDRKGDKGKGKMGSGATGREGKDGGKHIECLGGMRFQFFSDFVYPCNAGYPSPHSSSGDFTSILQMSWGTWRCMGNQSQKAL